LVGDVDCERGPILPVPKTILKRPSPGVEMNGSKSHRETLGEKLRRGSRLQARRIGRKALRQKKGKTMRKGAAEERGPKGPIIRNNR